MKEENKTANETSSTKLAVVLVRGLVKVRKTVKDTLSMLKLKRKNHCVVVDNNILYNGMLSKAKDYITWGEINNETFRELIKKRGEEFKSRETDRNRRYSYKALVYNGKKYKSYFRLTPPRKGFGRKGIKLAFKVGGALGYRGEKMNDLIKRML